MTTCTYTIETADTNDIDDIVEMFREQFRLHHAMNPVYYVSDNPELAQVIRKHIVKAIDESSPHLLVARAKEELAGFITFAIETNTYFDSNLTRYGEVIEVYIRELYRKSGLGRLLMEKAENYFREQGCNFAHLAACTTNEVAAKFYDHLGYTSTIDLRTKCLELTS